MIEKIERMIGLITKFILQTHCHEHHVRNERVVRLLRTIDKKVVYAGRIILIQGWMRFLKCEVVAATLKRTNSLLWTLSTTCSRYLVVKRSCDRLLSYEKLLLEIVSYSDQRFFNVIYCESCETTLVSSNVIAMIFLSKE